MFSVILGVDARVTTFVIGILLIVVASLCAMIFSLTQRDVITPTLDFLFSSFSFMSSPRFFVSCSVACAVAFAASWLETLSTHIEIRSNVIVQRKSVFGFGPTETGRFDADGLRVTFIKHDIFEFWLLGVGRLELWPGSEKHAFVVEHFPARLMARINHVLNANEVRVDPDN